MRTVELIPGAPSSVLGFGCAPILGAVDGSRARRAVFTALDEGVTHFDTAPSYGYGEGEAWLGRTLAGRRDRVVLATKYGIVATPLAKLLGPLKPLVRILRSSKKEAPQSSSPVQGPAKRDLFHSRQPISAGGLRQSLETSLRRLRTDHLDWLWLHEPQESLVDMDALAEVAGELKAEGKLRGWGLAYMRADEHKHGSVLPYLDALQFNLSPGSAGYDLMRAARADRPNVFFSPFREAPAGAERGDILRRLTTDFPRSVVLCSMFSPEHIRANCRSLQS